MTLASAVQVLLRRWLVIVIGLVLTLGAAGYVYLNTPPRYQATARMLLLLPSDSRGEQAIGSPFLYLPNGLNVLARIVSVTPTSREFQAALLAQGLTSQYEVGVDTTSPTITVSVEGDDPQNVIATRDGVIKAVQDDLLAIQREENAPRAQTAHTRVYAAEATPDQIAGDRMRGVLSVVAAGALLTLLAAFAIDRLSQSRKARKERRAAGGEPTRKGRKAAAAAAAATPDETPEPALDVDAEPPAFGLQTSVQDAAYTGDETETAAVAEGDDVAAVDAPSEETTDPGAGHSAPDEAAESFESAEIDEIDKVDEIDEAAAPGETLTGSTEPAATVVGDDRPGELDSSDLDGPRRAVDGADPSLVAEAPDESPAHR